jgi:glycerol uptake facilitator-like aquaporin
VSAPLSRSLAAEAMGTAFLLAIIVGSGIMGERLAGGNVAIALLANSLASGLGLAVLIAVFAPVSGAHFNPAVTLVAALEREISWSRAAAYMAVQAAAAFAGVACAHFMFQEPLFSVSTRVRTGAAQWAAEAIATFGLVVAIIACSRRRAAATPLVVGAYIASAYWFTSSTSFANPAVTMARAATNTFAGVRPDDVAAFVAAQLAAAIAAMLVMRWLLDEAPGLSAPRSRR